MNASDSVDLYSGAATQSVELVRLNGRNGLDLSVSIQHASRIYDAATIWNLSEPTGVLGLGWTLPTQTIVAAYGANVSDVSYYLVAGEHSGPLTCTSLNADGTQTYQLQNFRFWQITFDPARQLWTIVREDGTHDTYGDQENDRSTVQWGVRWGNWRGASATRTGQSPVPIAFNLSQVQNRFGDTVTWTYENVSEYVGPPPPSGTFAPGYTQASYLKSIAGVTGESVAFTYAGKTNTSSIQEYVVPHTNPAPPNAYQDRYLTRYLQSLTASAADGTPLFTQTFIYTDTAQQPAFLGTGAMAKRLLTGIVQTPAGETTSLPGPQFVYCGQATADQVSATAPYNASTQCLYGALKMLTTDGGGTIAYQYASVTPSRGSRGMPVTAPTAGGTTFSAPRFHFSRDFVVATWFGSDNTLRVLAYSWDGRWIAPGQVPNLDSLPVASAAAYDLVPVATGDALFGAYSQNQMHLYYADPARAGMWLQPSVTSGGSTVNYFTTAFGATEPVRLMTGDSFVAALGQQSTSLAPFRFTGSTWQADPVISLSQGTGTLCDAAAHENYLCGVSGTSAAGTAPLQMQLAILNGAGAWQQTAFSIPRSLSSIATLAATSGDTFAVVTIGRPSGPDTVSEHIAIWWSADGTQMSSQSLGIFTTSAGQSTAPTVHGSTIAIGQVLFRFDGLEWTSQDLVGSPLRTIAYADDLVARVTQTASTQFTYELLQFNPNTAQWGTSLALTGADATHLNALPVGSPSSSPFAIIDSLLYHRQPDASWQSATVTIPALTGDDAKSLTLAEDRFIAYQQNGGTTVYPLKNGGALTAVPLQGQQIYTPLTSLVGTTAFVSFTGTFGASGSTLMLYRVTADGVTGGIACYAVGARTASNGYQSTPTAYAYNTVTALPAADRALRTNLTTVAAGTAAAGTTPNGWIEHYYFNGLDPDEPPALAYPVDAANTNAAQFYSIVSGSLYDQRVYPVGAAPGAFVSEDVKYIWITTQALGQLARGFWSRTRKVTGVTDGVATRTLSSFSTDTGLVLQQSSSNYNSLGQSEQIVTQYRYFWEVYDPTRALNLLTPIAQTTMQTVVGQTTTTTSQTVTTYRSDWGSGAGRWAPDRTYRALSGTAPAFNNWQPGQGDPAGWLRTSTVLQLTSAGMPLVVADVSGVRSGIIYDVDGIMVTASVVNADLSGDEASYFGFETYEQANGWTWSDGERRLSEFLTGDEFHTGTQSVRIPGTPNQKVGPVRLAQPSGQTRVFVFGAWVKPAEGFNPAQGAAGIDVAVYNGTNNQLVTTLTLSVTATQNVWAYLQQTIDLPALRAGGSLPPQTPLYLRILGWNQNASSVVYLDDLRFSPVDATFAATVYDARKRYATAALGNNGATSRSVYDIHDRVVATIGAGERVLTLSAESFSRDLTASGTFQQAFPNSQLSMSTSSDSAYYDFHDASLSQWTRNGAGGTWSITGGQLTFTGTSTDPLGSTAVLKLFAFTNFAVRVVCTSQSACAGVGNGDAFVYWDTGAQVWKLARRQISGPPTIVARSNMVGFRREWVFAIVDGFVLFYADGTMIFAYDYQNPNNALPDIGKPALLLSKTGAFDDLVVLNNPQLSMTFLDGFMGTLQSNALLGYTTGTTYANSNAGVLLDAMGRPYVQRNTAQPALVLAPPPSTAQAVLSTTGELVKGDQTTYLVNSAGQNVSLDDYLNGTYGFDYTKYQFEASPLGRVTAAILPREQSQPANKFTVQYAYGAATASVIASVLPAGVESQYLMQTTTDQDGVVRYDIFDSLGKPVAIRVQTAQGQFVTSAIAYDASGNITLAKQPNYFAPPAGSAATDWQETLSYTFNGLLASYTIPDMGAGSTPGTTSYLYDSGDRPRFVSMPAGASVTPPQFVYTKYDALGRAIEEGYIQDAAVTWTTLAAVVNDQSYPNLATVAGRWLKKRQYDVDDHGNSVNLLGRLWRVSVSNGANTAPADTETFAYDDRGLATTVSTLTPAVDAQPYATGYAYDNQGRVSVLTYPHKSSETPFQVAYYYDRAGRVAAVGQPVGEGVVIDPSNPASGPEDVYGAYLYGGTSQMQQELLNNRSADGTSYSFTRSYSYNGPGWVTSIDDPFFTEQVSYYEQPGYGGAQYYSGVVSRTNYAFKPQPGVPPPADYGYQFAYDPMKRLRAAASSATDAGTLLIGDQGYDPNSNVRQLARGAATQTYSYQQSANNPAQKNNQVYNVTQQASTAIDFSATVTGWTWGASNGGPSTSAIIDHDGGKALQLGGGGLGHYEVLRFESYLPAKGVYRLTYTVSTPTDFAQSTGDTGWYVSIALASGQVVTASVGVVAATSGAWQQVTIPAIDLGAIVASLPAGSDPVSIACELRNTRRPLSGTGPGPAIGVTGIQIATTANVAGGAFGYTANGAVSAAPDRSLTLIAYDPVNRQPRQLQQADGASTALAYDGSDARLTASVGATTLLYLRDTAGKPLRLDTRTNGQTSTVYQIHGPTGLLGLQSSNGLAFALKDRLGSTRILVSDTNQILGGLDYLPFGESLREYGSVDTAWRFMGQEQDRQTALYAYQARLYDPILGRFYAPDAAGGSPYIFVGNNPLSFTDPDGNTPLLVGAAIDTAYQIAKEYPYETAATIGVAGVGTAAFFFPGAFVAAGAGIATAGATLWGGLIFAGGTVIGWAGTAITAGGNAAWTGTQWTLQHPRYAGEIALVGVGYYMSPSIGDFAYNAAVDISVSVISAHTVLRMLHVADGLLPFRHNFFVYPIGIGVLLTEGGIKGQMRRGIDYLLGNEQTRANIEFLRWEHFKKDGLINVASHALFTGFNFASAASPRASYPYGNIDVIYLKFPADFSHWNRWLFWRGWLVPYKGIASGHGSPLAVAHTRHNGHHWNAYGFGPHFPFAASANANAIAFLERWLIWYVGGAQRILPPNVGQVQQTWSPWTPVAAAWYPAFLQEFVYWHFQYGFTHLETPVQALGDLGGALINGTVRYALGPLPRR